MHNRVKYSIDSTDLYGLKQTTPSRHNAINSKYPSSKEEIPNNNMKSPSKKHDLKDFIIDFEQINKEMMQNQFDKANIMGYGN